MKYCQILSKYFLYKLGAIKINNLCGKKVDTLRKVFYGIIQKKALSILNIKKYLLNKKKFNILGKAQF